MKQFMLLFLFAVALTSAAQAGGMIGFGVQADYSSVSVAGPLKDIYGPGYGGGLHLDINFVPMLALRATGDYILFSPDNGKYRSALSGLLGGAASGFALDGGKISILAFALNAKFALPVPVFSPYATAGVGSATFGQSDATVTYNGVPQGNLLGVKPATKSTMDIGAGVDLHLASVSLYLEAKYTWIFTDGSTSTYLPVSLGITF